MSVKLGIYDIFSCVLPGAMFLLTAYYSFWLWIDFDVLKHWGSINFFNSIVLGAVSYVLGNVLAAISNLVPWKLLTGRKNPSEAAYEEIIDLYNNYNFSFKHNQWPVLQSHITLRSTELASRADKHRATGLMLRSIALCFIFCSVTCLAFYYDKGGLIYVGAAVGLVFVAIMLVFSSHNFSKWSYKSVFETTLALQGGLGSDIISKKLDNDAYAASS